MEAFFQNRRVKLGPKDLIGQGGEASVYRAGPHALKIYSGDAATVAAKAVKLREFPSGVPAFVLAPLGAVTGPQQDFIGYGMNLLAGAIDLRLYGDRKFREAKVSQAETGALLAQVGARLEELHQAGLVVGDLNDGNVLVKDQAAYFIDADSYQFGAQLCTVAHERFLDPRLYGAELSRRQVFSPDSDWYAFDVLVYTSLLFVHPYGGVLAGAPTLLRRAEARSSLLRAGVKLPQTALLPECLSEALIERFLDTFERDRRGPFPLALLSAPWVRCSCGLEHQRQSCPACRTAVVVPAPIERRAGRVVATRVFRTDGAILAARYQGGLKVLYRDGSGELRREDGAAVPGVTGASYAIAGGSTIIATEARVAELRGERVCSTAPRSLSFGQPLVAATASRVFRMEDDWLIDGRSGARLGSVLENATWIAAGEDRGIGLYRVGKLTCFFCFGGGSGALSPVELPSIEGRLVSAEACFDGTSTLLILETIVGGQRHLRLHLLDARGAVLASAEGPAGSAAHLGEPRSFALFSGRILRATDRGLLSVEVDRRLRTLSPGRLFPDTEPFISSDSELLAGPGGSVFVVGLKEIVELRLE